MRLEFTFTFKGHSYHVFQVWPGEGKERFSITRGNIGIQVDSDRPQLMKENLWRFPITFTLTGGMVRNERAFEELMAQLNKELWERS